MDDWTGTAADTFENLRETLCKHPICDFINGTVKGMGRDRGAYSVRIRNSVGLRSNTKRKEPDSPLIRRSNLPSCAAEASRLKGYLALPPEVHPVRHTLAPPGVFTRTYIRARRVREAGRLKKPYTPGVHRLGPGVITSADIMRVSCQDLVGSRWISSLLSPSYSDEDEMLSVYTYAGRDARMRGRLRRRRSFATELLETRFGGAIDFFGHSTLSIPARHSEMLGYRSDVYIVSDIDCERTHCVRTLFPCSDWNYLAAFAKLLFVKSANLRSNRQS